MLGQASLFPPDITLPLRKRIDIRLATAAEARYAIESFHYLHRMRTGRQLHYAIHIDGIVDGYITYAYPVGANHLLGYSPGEIVEFARLYLASNVPHSASCAIAKSLRRLPKDWAALYPEAATLRLVVSWSDRHFHKGTIYKAANFEWLGESKGAAAGGLTRGHTRWGERRKYADQAHLKDCWIYRLP
jgi:hypothetical protein